MLNVDRENNLNLVVGELGMDIFKVQYKANDMSNPDIHYNQQENAE
jgi:hypothetical protein